MTTYRKTNAQNCYVSPVKPTNGQQGIALVGVLWIVALLSMVALGVSFTVRSEIRMARNMLSLAQAQYAAEGAIELAVSSHAQESSR